MLDNTHFCINPSGEDFLNDIFRQSADATGYAIPEEAADILNAIFTKLSFLKSRPQSKISSLS